MDAREELRQKFYAALLETRQGQFKSEVVPVDSRRYQVDFEVEKSPLAWGNVTFSYLSARYVAQHTGLFLLASSEWSVLRSQLQGKDVELEKKFWSGHAELTDTLVDFDNGLVIEHPVLVDGGLSKTWFGNVRAERVFKTKVPKGVEGYLCDIDGFDEFFDAVYGINNARQTIGESAYVWTADKGVKVVVRANAEEQDEENRFSLDSTIDLAQDSEENELFGARLCRIKLV